MKRVYAALRPGSFALTSVLFFDSINRDKKGSFDLFIDVCFDLFIDVCFDVCFDVSFDVFFCGCVFLVVFCCIFRNKSNLFVHVTSLVTCPSALDCFE